MGCAQSIEPVPSTFHEKYLLSKRLGTGSYASVYSAVRQELEIPPSAAGATSGVGEAADGALAVKVIDLRGRRPSRASLEALTVDQSLIQSVEQEARILRKVSGHPNIIRFEEVLRDPDLAYIVMEQCSCSLLDGLERMPSLTESALSCIFRQMLQGVAAVHAAGVSHRDVKPDNFLFAEDGTLKLCDFGLSEVCGMGGLKGEFGTLPYMAPEMLSGQAYDLKVDVWSVGAIFYVLLYGKFPYMGRSIKAMEANIRSGDPAMDFWPARELQVRRSHSQNASSFMEMLMQRSPAKRPMAKDVLTDSFMTSCSERSRREISLRPMLEAAKDIGAFGAAAKPKAVTAMDLRLSTRQEWSHGRTPWMRAVEDALSEAMSKRRPSVTSNSTVSTEGASEISSQPRPAQASEKRRPSIGSNSTAGSTEDVSESSSDYSGERNFEQTQV